MLYLGKLFARHEGDQFADTVCLNRFSFIRLFNIEIWWLQLRSVNAILRCKRYAVNQFFYLNNIITHFQAVKL